MVNVCSDSLFPFHSIVNCLMEIIVHPKCILNFESNPTNQTILTMDICNRNSKVNATPKKYSASNNKIPIGS